MTSSSSSIKTMDRLLRWLGLDRETHPVIWLTFGGAALIILTLYLSYGTLLAAAAVLGLLGILILTFYRIDFGFYMLIACVLLLEQFNIPGFTPFTAEFEYFRNIKGISYLPTISVGVINPLELHLFLILFVWFLLMGLRSDCEFQPVPVWGAAFLFFGWLGFSFLRGIGSGGDFLTALWEVRALFYLGILYMLVPQIIQTRKQINIFLWICIAAITFKALQGILRFSLFGFSFLGYSTLTNHEDPVFMNTLFILLFGLLLYNSTHTQKKVLLLLAFPLALGSYVSQRRAAYAGFMVCTFLLVGLSSGQRRILLLKIITPVVMLFGAYVAVGWNAHGAWAEPAKMIKSGVAPLDKSQMSREDYLSNLYRKSENYNLGVTVHRNPIFGIGFGKKYDRPVPLANIAFPLRDYIPHNQIFWILVKTGGIGFFLFWMFFNSFAYRATLLHQKLTDPYLKAVCLMVLLAIINQMVVSFYDLQLTYYRNMVYLGSLMGLLPTLEKLHKEERENEDEEEEEMIPE